jgi:nucleoside-diphosphate-sugar epimerase
MKVLITGGSGFLGLECVRILREHGHDVVSTDRHGNANLFGDLAEMSFVRTLPDADAVVHCAAKQYVSVDLPAVGRKEYFYRNNVLATRNLALRYSGNAHFVNVSTSMVYHQSGLDLYTESSPKKPQGYYSASKLRAQEYVDSMPNPTSTVIPCIIAGGGRGGLFEKFVRSVNRFGVIVLPGKGEHPVHMVHVRDAANLVVMVVEKRATGMYNAASPGPLSINTWIDEIEDELGLRTVKRIRLPLAPFHFVSRVLGYIPLAQEQLLMLKFKHVLSVENSLSLGWEPQWTNARIVRETARFLVRRVG